MCSEHVCRTDMLLHYLYYYIKNIVMPIYIFFPILLIGIIFIEPLPSIMPLNAHSNPLGGVQLSPLCRCAKLRLREVKCFAQGHTAGGCLSQDLNPGLCDISVLAFSPRTPGLGGTHAPRFLLPHHELL